MRKNWAVLFLVLVFVAAGAMIASTAKAAPFPLQNNGGNLIYDPNLNITWYDPSPPYLTWDQAVSWAASLTTGGTSAGSWSLPAMLPASEMAYLYYVDLGNSLGSGLVNKGPFTALWDTEYWEDKEYLSSGAGWVFNFYIGVEGAPDRGYQSALAVHSGDVLGNGVVLPNGPSSVPVPATLLLLGPGLVGLAALKRKYIG